MATTGLLALIDDIAALLDDVAILTKVAAKKTAGVLGDDLALNAEQVSGIRVERELPVIWAVAKGSFINKLILVPASLAISVFIPWLIIPLLLVGGLYLCFEGAEKILHKFFHNKIETQQKRTDNLHAVANESIDLVSFEKAKINGAIRTDFILSAEIIVIALGTVKDTPFLTQALVVSSIALFVTVGVYSLVAAIVKIDDLGTHLIRSGKGKESLVFVGKLLLIFAPLLMKALSFLGTLAMFLVGGGIIVHGIPPIHNALHHINHFVAEHTPGLLWLSESITSGITGILSGLLVVVILHFIPLKKWMSKAS